MGIDLFDAFVVPRLSPGRCRFDIAHLPLVEGLHPSTSTAPANMIYALPVNSSVRLPPLTLAGIPEGVNDCAVRTELVRKHGLEIGGGLGEFAGQAWRIGLMGASSTPRHVELCLSALEEALG